MNEEVTASSEKYVDIHPLTKGKRILVFLADFFIHFILSFLIFNIMVAPIGKVITNYEAKNDEHILLTLDMYDHYYNAKVLLKDDSFDRTDVTAGVEYSYRCFLSYFVLDNEESIDSKHPQYGRKKENDVIYHFYKDIRNDEQTYIDSFKYYNAKDNYFVYDETTKEFNLKKEVKNEIYSFYDPKDAMGDIGNKYYSAISKNVFNPLLAEVMKDIEKNDLHFAGEKRSFLDCKNRIKQLETYHENLMTISAIISHVVIWLVLFLILPIVRKDRKTLAMILMKIEKVNFYTLNHTSRAMVVLTSIYYLFATMLGIMFVPSLLVPFNNLFALHFLMYGSVFSIVLLLGSMFFILFNQYNRSLIDYLSNSLYLTSEEMDEIYRARGYKI
ncbi:MAG: RDD family protein [Bacilli bacterium]|nr:RDD family protein [Bacilli bacterium]